MKALIFCAIIVAVSAIFEIDELRKMVPTYADKAQLKVLDDDKYTSRSQIQQQVNQIVQRQSPDIQTAYNTILQAEQRKEAYEQQQHIEMMRSRGATEQLISIQQQINAIDNDYSLSRQEAKNQIRALMTNLSYSDRRLLDD